jgi:hypothetical protein
MKKNKMGYVRSQLLPDVAGRRLRCTPSQQLSRCQQRSLSAAYLRAVAVVHVEVDDGDAADAVAVRAQGVVRCDDDVVEDAEAAPLP